MFRRASRAAEPRQSPGLLQERLKRLVGEARDRPTGLSAAENGSSTGAQDIMALLVELRAAARRGAEPTAAARLGSEFTRYLGEFYNLQPELQAPAIETLLLSQQAEREGDLAAAADVCERGLKTCPNYLPFLERLAELQRRRGDAASAATWYTRLLSQLDNLELFPRSLEVCRALVESKLDWPELLEQCGRRLEAGGEPALAARCWEARAAQLLAAGQVDDALAELDRAISLQPESAGLYFRLAQIYEQLGQADRAAAAYQQAEGLALGDPATLGQLLVIRARLSRPDEVPLGRLLDLLETEPEQLAPILDGCEVAIAAQPYNPHLRYLQGVLLAHGGQLERGLEALNIAAERYSAQADRDSELEVRLSLQGLLPEGEANTRRIAALHFERGEAGLAMKVLAGLARAARQSG